MAEKLCMMLGGVISFSQVRKSGARGYLSSLFDRLADRGGNQANAL